MRLVEQVKAVARWRLFQAVATPGMTELYLTAPATLLYLVIYHTAKLYQSMTGRAEAM